MVDIDPTAELYGVGFKPKDKRPNKTDDKMEILRKAAGIRDTPNIIDLVKEADRTKNDIIKKQPPGMWKDEKTIVDINLYEIPVVHIKLTTDQAQGVRKDPNVEYVVIPPKAHIMAEEIPWGISRVGADQVDATVRHRGYGVSVGIIDSGMDYNHTDLKPNYKGGWSFLTNTDDPMDDNNLAPDGKTKDEVYHGTHVSGTVGAAINNFGVVGVAPEVFLYAAKTQDASGNGDYATITEAVIWTTQNNFQVINMSLGGTGTYPALADAVKKAHDSNCFVACSSGNDSKLQVNYPAGYPGAWATGAVDDTDTLASFSSWGPVGYVDFTCPGVNILSDQKGNRFHTLQGTSMASPHTAGMAALAMANYRFSPCDTNTYDTKFKKIDHVVGAMISSCDTLGQTSPGVQSQKYGYGMPQVSQILSILTGGS